MERCPHCRARLREGARCGRCGADLRRSSDAERRAAELERLVVQCLARDDVVGAERALQRSLVYCRRPLAVALRGFTAALMTPRFPDAGDRPASTHGESGERIGERAEPG